MSSRNLSTSAHGSARRYETWQSGQGVGVCPTQRLWGRLNFAPLGNGAMGMVNNLTKNFFAILSFQWWRTIITCFGIAFLNLGPFLGIFLSHGWARLPYGIALFSMFSIYVGMSRKSPVPPYYFFLHPISTVLFVYTLLRSMFLTLSQDGVVWRGTKYPLDELRKGMV